MKTKCRRKAIDRFLELPPERINLEVGRYYLRNGVLDIAIAAFTILIDASPSNPLWLLYRAGAYWRSSRWSDACEDLTRAIELDPKVAVARYYRAQLYEYFKKNNEAIDDYSAVLEMLSSVNMHWDHVFNNPEPAYYHNGEYGIASQDFYSIIKFKLNPAHPYRKRAQIYAKIGLTNLAVEGFKKAIELNPKDIDSYAWIAGLESLEDKWEIPKTRQNE